MALQIEESNGVFVLKGALNNGTAQSFKTHFNAILSSGEKVIINIENVDEIDLQGFSVLKDFLINSNKENQSFHIIGYGCKEAHHNVESNYAA